MKLIKGTDAIDRGKWMDLLEASRFSSPFQTREYVDMIRAGSEFDAEVYAAEHDGMLQALCVLTWVRKKGIKSFFPKRYVHGGPVIRDIGPEALLEFLTLVARDQKRSATHMEIKNYFDYSFCRDALTKAGWVYHPYVSVQIGLKGKDMAGVLAGMKSNRRREIGYSEQEGAEVREIGDEQELKHLYEILAGVFREKKVPLPRFEHFRGLQRWNSTLIQGVYHQGRLLGGSVCLIQPGRTIYTLYYCRVADCPRRIYPTHLAIKAAIAYALEHHLETVDLMGAGMTEGFKGIRDYKTQFGDLVEYGSYFRMLRPGLFHLRKGAIKVLKIIRKGRAGTQSAKDL